MWRPMRRCYFAWHTAAQLFRRRKLIKDSRLSKCASPHCITIATVNFFHFTLTMANLHILSTVAKGKLNTFSIAHKHEVNGMIQAYTSIRQMEHSLSLLFCEKWLQMRYQMWHHQHSTHTLACVHVVYSVLMHLGAIHTATAAAICHCIVLKYLCCHTSSVNHDFVWTALHFPGRATLCMWCHGSTIVSHYHGNRQHQQERASEIYDHYRGPS